VVLFLKILLSQYNLDEPFTGGLGSYKLYVLVADHLERHVALGGVDRPGTVLMGFLYRYGCCGKLSANNCSYQTKLSQHQPMETHSGSFVDLSNVFKLNECVYLFRLCWERVCQQVNNGSTEKRSRNQRSSPVTPTSILAWMVCPNRLHRDREAKLRQLNQAMPTLSSIANVKRTAETTLKGSSEKKRKIHSPSSNTLRDRTSGELMAGYGVQNFADL
jgi:hypothetical protein